MDSWIFTVAIDQDSDEEFARAVGFVLPKWEAEIPFDREEAPDNLLAQADFWSRLHRAG